MVGNQYALTMYSPSENVILTVSQSNSFSTTVSLAIQAFARRLTTGFMDTLDSCAGDAQAEAERKNFESFVGMVLRAAKGDAVSLEEMAETLPNYNRDTCTVTRAMDFVVASYKIRLRKEKEKHIVSATEKRKEIDVLVERYRSCPLLTGARKALQKRTQKAFPLDAMRTSRECCERNKPEYDDSDDPTVEDCLNLQCTFAATGYDNRGEFDQPLWECKTCGTTHICIACAFTCHRDHVLVAESGGAYMSQICSCGEKDERRCREESVEEGTESKEGSDSSDGETKGSMDTDPDAVTHRLCTHRKVQSAIHGQLWNQEGFSGCGCRRFKAISYGPQLRPKKHGKRWGMATLAKIKTLEASDDYDDDDDHGGHDDDDNDDGDDVDDDDGGDILGHTAKVMNRAKTFMDALESHSGDQSSTEGSEGVRSALPAQCLSEAAPGFRWQDSTMAWDMHLIEYLILFARGCVILKCGGAGGIKRHRTRLPSHNTCTGICLLLSCSLSLSLIPMLTLYNVSSHLSAFTALLYISVSPPFYLLLC